MKLYDYTQAPSPRRVRIFAAEKGIQLDLVQVDLMTAANLQPEFLAINPRGLVPALQLADGTVIDEAVSICRYLEELYPEPNLMGMDARERAIIDSRTRHMEMDGFLPGAEAFRNTSPVFAKRGLQGVTEEVPAIPALAERGFAGIRRFYESLERDLSRQPFIAGSRFTIADITGLCVVDFYKWVRQAIPAQNTHTLRWYATVSARPSIKA